MFASQSVTLTLDDEIDVSRGDMIVRPGNVPRVEQKFDATVVWMAEEPMVPGKSYWFKQTSKLTAEQRRELTKRAMVRIYGGEPKKKTLAGY